MNEPVVYSNEPTLFRICAVISILVWLLIVVGTLGVALIYLLFGFLFYLFAQSAFTSYLQGNAVLVSAGQYPELYARYRECCEQLDLKAEPRLYLLQSEGMINALALRFLNRNYVVLFSSIVDALEPYPESLRFYIGHELCHIVRNHLKWGFWLWPGTILPVLGPAYERAQETTCDYYGLACSKSPADAVRAMAVIACGPEQWRGLNVKQYCRQADESGGFWMSFHELIGGYPWLSKRVARIVALSEERPARFPKRSVWAGLLSIFFPNVGRGAGGGLVSLMMVIAIIGILAAVAIPAYQDYTIRAKVQSVMTTAVGLSNAIAEHVDQTGEIPQSIDSLGYSATPEHNTIQAISYDASNASFAISLTGVGASEGQTMEFMPSRDDEGVIRWDCSGGSLPAKYRPVECR